MLAGEPGAGYHRRVSLRLDNYLIGTIKCWYGVPAHIT
jgi:hypothetical protein